MTQRLDAKGIFVDIGKWDDGSDHDGISKIYIGCGIKGVRCIYFDYVKSGKSIEGSCHGTQVPMVWLQIILFIYLFIYSYENSFIYLFILLKKKYKIKITFNFTNYLH